MDMALTRKQVKFPLPKLSALLTELRDDLLNGKGFILFKKFPAGAWSPSRPPTARRSRRCAQHLLPTARRRQRRALHIHWRLFTSSQGYLGLAPHGSKEGDWIFVVLGADIPYVLRPGADGSHELIGEAYVQGIMDGEVMQMEQIPVQDIALR